MSTKIHTGFRFRESDIHAAHERLMGWRAELKPLHADAVARFLAKEAVEVIDRGALGLLKNDAIKDATRPLSAAYRRLRDRQAEVRRTRYRDPEVDFEFSVSIMPHDGRLYGIVYSERSEWVRRFLRKPWVEAYPYWNNTDKPRGLTSKAWDERGRVWDDVLGPSGVPALVGFSAEGTDSLTPFPDVARVLKRVAPIARRAVAFAREAITDERLRAVPVGEPMHNVVRAINESADWMDETPEGKAALAAQIDRITPLLPTITRGVLHDGYPA